MLLCSLPWHLGPFFFDENSGVSKVPIVCGIFFWITLKLKVPDVVCVASNAFGRGHMKARVLEFVGCHNILWKSVLTLSFSMSFLAAFWATAGWFLLAGHGPSAKNIEKQAAGDVD